MLELADSTGHADAQRRLQLIRYAVRTNQWWQARQTLDQATAAEDWRVLGYPSPADYHATALRPASPLG